MKIVHTSDWHAGRVWKGRNRLDELENALTGLAEFVEENDVDLVLVTGDLFDSGMPSGKAEHLVFRSLKRFGDAGAQTVAIAGNHDSAIRFEAFGVFAEFAGVHTVGRPKPANAGGLLEIPTRSGERALVAAVPFASTRFLVSALEQAASDTEAAQSYADRMRAIVTNLASHFRADTVNLVCLHTHLDGAQFTRSERRVHLGDDWAASPQSLPADAHYIALGHIHMPQKVPAPSPAYYAGSPLQLDFGEEGQTKTFVEIDATPGKPAKVTHHEYEGTRSLHDLHLSLDEITRRADELAELGWLRIRVPLDAPDPSVNRRVRDLLPNAVSVDVELPDEERPTDTRPTLATATPAEVFRSFYQQEYGRAASDAVVELFEQYREELETPR